MGTPEIGEAVTTIYVSHPDCLRHDTGPWHPERPQRLKAIEDALTAETFQNLHRCEAPLADVAAIERVHPARYVESVKSRVPTGDTLVALDGGDTVLSAGSWDAALRAVGAATFAVDEVIGRRAKNAFCAIRPCGHHAEPSRAMGFCLFSNVAVAAFHARAVHGVERIAVVDFDVHHGNGTQAAFWNEPDFLFASTHEMPLFPGTGAAGERGVSGNIVNVPLRSGDGGIPFRAACESVIFPALRSHKPDLIMISAGFDAHRDDPLASLNLVEGDFAWITRALTEIADELCGGRVVSVLEGGYDLTALGKSVAVHVQALCEAY